MRILIMGAGKMGSFFTDVLSFEHEVAVYDVAPNVCALCTIATASPIWKK